MLDDVVFDKGILHVYVITRYLLFLLVVSANKVYMLLMISDRFVKMMLENIEDLMEHARNRVNQILLLLHEL